MSVPPHNQWGQTCNSNQTYTYECIHKNLVFNSVFFVSSFTFISLMNLINSSDKVFGLVVRVSGYRFRSPGATRFFLRSSGSGTGSTQPRDDN
jgi:hypothetical protein